jgi:hypothetical protein
MLRITPVRVTATAPAFLHTVSTITARIRRLMTDSYEICIHGRLKTDLLTELGDLRPVAAGPLTRLTLETEDQASLHGVLSRIRDLGLVVESVERASQD